MSSEPPCSVVGSLRPQRSEAQRVLAASCLEAQKPSLVQAAPGACAESGSPQPGAEARLWPPHRAPARCRGAGLGSGLWAPAPLQACAPAPGEDPRPTLVVFRLLMPVLFLPGRSVQTFADKSKQEALKNDLVEALKRKQQC